MAARAGPSSISDELGIREKWPLGPVREAYLAALDGVTNLQAFNPSKHSFLNRYIVEVKTKCKINLHLNGYNVQGIKNVFKSLTGDQRMRVLKEIKIDLHFEKDLVNADGIEWLWTWFYNIMNELSINENPINSDDLKNRCQKSNKPS